MNLLSIVNGMTVPWHLAAIGILVLFTSVRMIGAWRQSKRSPYFFLRQQAEKRLQAYFWATFGLLALAGATMAFSWQTPDDNTARMALLANAKPVDAADSNIPELAFDTESPQSITYDTLADSLAISETTAVSEGADLPGDRSLPEGLSLSPALPDEFDQVEPEVELTPDTEFTPLVFSTEINDDYEPISPRNAFGEGFFTIYATFDYVGMADGMAWSWIWRRNGEIVNGGNELWAYGEDGPGWIYYEPPEGFQPGEHTLEVWVNGELFDRASLTVESEVANQ